jgi:DNA sulfur modification protein DndB
VVLPLTALDQFVEVDKIGDPKNELNREIKKQHIQACEAYLDQEPEFVLGGIVLAAEDHTRVAFEADDKEIDGKLRDFDKLYIEACESSSPDERKRLDAELEAINDEVEVCSGKVWLPYGVRFEVTDGQHRIRTILNRIKDGDVRLQHPSQGIAAMILIEQRDHKRQQDFVDLGQTEPIKPTIKIDMDWRQPVTKLVKDMVEHVPIFADQFIEFRRPSIRKNTQNLYSLSNVKTAVQAMLLGNTRLGAAEAQRKLTEKLSGPSSDLVRATTIDYFSRLSQEVKCFREILEDPDSTDFVKVREQHMCLNSVGLAVMGMVGHEAILGRSSVEDAVQAVAKIDWSRDNPLWEGTLRVGPGVARGGNVIELGGSIVKAVGGLRLTERDVERLKAVDGLKAKLPAGCLKAPTVAEPTAVAAAAAAEVTPDEDGQDNDAAEALASASVKGGA